MKELGLQLHRIKLDDEQETLRIQNLALELSGTLWLTSPNIKIIPYIDGKPAGTARQADVLWLDGTLYAENKPLAKLAKAVAQELGKAFRKPDIGDAIKLCFDRDPEFIRSFMDENFELAREEELSDQAVKTENDFSNSPSDGDAMEHSPPQPDDKNNEATTFTDGSDDDDDASEIFDAHAEKDSAEDDSEAQIASQDEADAEEEIIYRPVKPRQTKPKLIERFAGANGFKKDEDGYFFSEDGRTITKAHGSLFPWELRSATGDVTTRLLPKEHCLELEPLQLGADIWGVL